MNPQVKKIGNKLFLGTQKVELGLVDDIEKLKKDLLSEWKNHVSKRNSFGSNSSKILTMVGEQERAGVELKKEVDVLEKKLLDISNQITKLRNQANSLGLELPQSINLLDGVSLSAYGNKFVDTREIVDEFSDKLK